MPIPSTHNPAEPGEHFDTSDAKTPSKGDEKLLKQLRDHYTYSVKGHELNRKLGDWDMQALYAEYGPWDPLEVQARKLANRPCIHLPQLGQHTNALVNQVRQNPQGVKVNPAGNGATDQTADLRGNRIRAVNAECNAKQAFLTALQCAAERGYGVVTLETEEIDWDGFDQRIKVVREPDPDAILWDPDYKEADASDIQYGFKLWRLPREEYKRRWPKAAVQDFKTEDYAIAPDWCQSETQLVARYSYIEKTERHLYLLNDGSPKGLKVFRDELPKGWKVEKGWLIYPDDGPEYRILKQKDAVEKTVKQCTTNGVEILAKNDWAGKYIPIFPMVGKEVWMLVDGKKQRLTLSYIRQAIHGQRAFNSAKTNEVESANMVPKATYIGYEGQFDTQTDWPNINKIPTSHAEVKARTDESGDQILPHPARIDWNPQIESMEIMAEAARRAIQAAIGSHGFTITDDTNVKSGKAVNALKKQSDIGSYHFIDGYETTIRAVGRAEDDLLDKIEDTPRDVGLDKKDGTHEIVRINEPVKDKKGQEIERRYTPRGENGEPMTDARHDVVIDSGDSYETQQEEASVFVETLLASPMGPRVADLAIKWKNLGTFGDQMAERVQPPDTIEMEGEDIPPQVKQILGQLNQQNQQLTQSVQQLLAERESKQQDLDSKRQIEQDKIKSQEQIAALNAEVEKLKIQAQVRMKELDLQMKGLIVNEQLSSAENLAQQQQDADRQIQELSGNQALDQGAQAHEQTLEQQDAASRQAAEQSEREHAQALEQQDQASQATMAQQEQAASLAPKPAEPTK